jgi:hypothetical protein
MSNEPLAVNSVKNVASTRLTARALAKKFAVIWCAFGAAGFAAPSLHAQELSDDWQFGVAIYGWLPDIAGNTNFPVGGDSSIHVDIGTILDHLKMTAQGSFEIQKGRWGAFTDLVYLDVGDSTSKDRDVSIGGLPLPATVTTSLDFDLKTTIWSLAASYRVMAEEQATFDLLAGARLFKTKQTLDWRFTGDFGPITPPPLTGTRSSSVDQWDAIVGGKGRIALGQDRTWYVPYYVDIGAGDSDLTWQAMVGLSYEFGWGNVGIAWRYLDYDLANGPMQDLNINGPAIGAMFRW